MVIITTLAKGISSSFLLILSTLLPIILLISSIAPITSSAVVATTSTSTAITTPIQSPAPPLNQITSLSSNPNQFPNVSLQNQSSPSSTYSITTNTNTTTDTTPPDTAITSAVDGGNGANVENGGTISSSPSSSISFTFTGTDDFASVAGYQCSIDGLPAALCKSPVNVFNNNNNNNNNNLAPGNHTFQVRAIDTSGNVDPTSAIFSWTQQQQQQQQQIFPPPPSSSSSLTQPAIVEEPEGYNPSQDPNVVPYQNQSQSLAPSSSSPFLNQSLVPNINPYQQNQQPSPPLPPPPPSSLSTSGLPNPLMSPTNTTTDTTPPDTAITSAVDGGNGANVENGGTISSSPSSSISFTFTGTDDFASVAGYQCSIDGLPAALCKSPVNVFNNNNLAPGNHTFQVRAIDTSGNVDPTPAMFTWIIADVSDSNSDQQQNNEPLYNIQPITFGI
jgi:large repetitive protein